MIFATYIALAEEYEMNEKSRGAPSRTEPAQLSDDEWRRIEHLFLADETRPGRPRQNVRRMIDAVLWVCSDNNRWHHLPASYPPQQTCYTHFLKWRRNGVLMQVAEELHMPYDSLCALPAPQK